MHSLEFSEDFQANNRFESASGVQRTANNERSFIQHISQSVRNKRSESVLHFLNGAVLPCVFSFHIRISLRHSVCVHFGPNV